MKVVILAGGLGTRLSEETIIKPKPIVNIGGRPIIWHIMKIFSHYGYNEFIICCGYKGYLIKEYFLNFTKYNSNLEIDLSKDKISLLNKKKEKFKILLIDTGDSTMTGGRLKKIRKYLDKDQDFFMTYGDGVANIDLIKLIKYHKKHKKKATVTIVQPKGRYGSVKLDKKSNMVQNFIEKPKGDKNWINGGFFVLNEKVIDYIKNDKDIWERKPLENLAKNNQLAAYKHQGFWKAMDTLNDKKELDQLIKKKKAPWMTWE